MDLETQGVNLTVYDVTGKQIYSFQDKTSTGTFEHELNLKSMPVGVYILQLQTEKQVISKKLILK
jgi:uncharacterized membrane protein